MSAKQTSAMLGRLVEHQSSFYGLPTDDGQWVIQHPRDAIAFFVEAIRNRGHKKNAKCISDGEKIVINDCDGSECLSDASDIFIHIDPDFKKCCAYEKGAASSKQEVVVYEIVEDVILANMFVPLNKNIGELSFTSHQIKQFVVTHGERWFRTDGYGTFFLLRSGMEVFVAYITLSTYVSIDYQALLYPLGYLDMWEAYRKYRFVVPKL